MGALFDLRTLYLIGSLACAICGLTLLTSRRIHRPSESALTWAAGAQLLVCLSMLTASLRTLIPDWVSVVLSNTAGPAGIIVLYESVRRLCQVRPYPTYAFAAIAGLFAFQAWLGTSHLHMELRLQVTSIVQGVYAAMTLPLLYRRRPADPRIPMTAGIALAYSVVGLHLLRLVWVSVFGAQLTPDGLFAAGLMQATVAAFFALVPMMHAMTLMALVNGRLSADLRRIATTDDLTGLSNRRHFFRRSRDQIGREGASAAVLMLDLDWFKQVNDRYGHKVGDNVLIHFTAILRRALGRNDLAGRYGGEEFCALFERDSEEELRLAAQRLCDDVRNSPYEDETLTIPISVSIGMAMAKEGASVEELVSIADRRVYLAKAMGRDRVIDRRSALQAAASSREQPASLQVAIV